MSKLRITPIGTCRIHSPLKRAALRYPIEIDLRRNFGYVHTSAEALQQLRYLQGEKAFAPEIVPLIFRDSADASKLADETWEPSDLHIVEISSAKSIKAGDDYVQVNYLYRRFADFFASAERARVYWSLVKKADRSGLVDFLKEHRSFRVLSREDRHLLIGLAIEQQSFKAIKSDMAAIVERLGKDKVLFVTHVNALTPDESVIPSRDRLIGSVKLAGEQLGVEVFDPTPVMLEFGQERALEKGGLDATHYTPVFFEKVYEDLHRSHVGAHVLTKVGAVSDEKDDEQLEVVAANFETMLEIGDFFSTSRDVHAALESAPDAAPLLALRGLIRSRIGDYANAMDDFAASGTDAILSQPMRMAQLHVLNAAGKHAEGLAVAESLIADEFASADLYMAASRAAEACAKMASAIGYAKQAFRSDHSDLTPALRALTLLISTGNEEEIAEWRTEVLENSVGSSAGAFEICMWAIMNHDDSMLVAGIRALGTLDKGGTIDLLEEAMNADMIEAVARSIPSAVALGRLPRSLAGRRSALFQTLLDRVDQLLNDGRLEAASRVAGSLAELQDVESSQIAGPRLALFANRLLRSILRDVRVAVRLAFRSRDFEAIAEINRSAGNLVAEDLDSSVLVARALHSLGRETEAVRLIKSAYDRSPNNYLAARWGGRLAFMAGDFITSLRLYGLLRSSFAKEAEKFGPEMDRFFSVAARRAPRVLRQLAVDARYSEAAELADLIEMELGAHDIVERERRRMLRALRISLKDIDEGRGDIEEREEVLRHLVRLKPDDEAILRRLALELMRQFRFGEAAEIWDSIVSINPDNESAQRNLERCRRLALRGASSGSADRNASG